MCSRLLSLDLDVTGLDHIPASGAFILAANHPTGIADGVAVYDALTRVRPDIAIFTNRDAIRINPRLVGVPDPGRMARGRSATAPRCARRCGSPRAPSAKAARSSSSPPAESPSGRTGG